MVDTSVKSPIAILALLLGIAAVFVPFKSVALLLLAITIVFIIFARPEYSLFAVISYSVIDWLFRSVISSSLFSNIWDEALYIIIVLLWIYKTFWQNNSKKLELNLTPLFAPIFMYMVYSIFLVIVNSTDIAIAIDGLRVNIEYIFWFFVAINMVKDRDTINKLMVFFILIVTAMALYGIYQYIIGVKIPPEWIDKAEMPVRTRVFSILTSPNILGSLMVLAIPINISYIFNSKHLLKKVFYSATSMAMLACLLFTFTRGAWLALVVSLLIYAFLKDKRIIGLLVIIGIIALFIPPVYNRISYLVSPTYLVSSMEGGRLKRLQIGLNLLSQSPIIGIGLGQFGGATAARFNVNSLYSDNYFLKILVETGYIGIILFIYLLLSVIRQFFVTMKRCEDRFIKDIVKGIFAGLMGVVFHNLVENVFEVPMMSTYFWFLTGIIVVSSRLKSPIEKSEV
ncbi:O-antigen ligase family protein [Caldanaerobius polysaccharolyticus]|uniref:O-antigen ligase family protein n=1 Tax=Caldanaerobius polysaccharolyticus TaxID=44256 RepID=UPI00068A63D0|nr:O-antigen ligase family protein [Caldanaerobius polysaccharolyticus]